MMVKEKGQRKLEQGRRRIAFWFVALLLLLAGCGGDGEVPSLAGGDVLFSEAFLAGETGSWQLEADTVGKTAVINDQLIIEIGEPNLMQFASLTEPAFTNFDLSVEAKQLAGNPQSSYGVLFRMQGPEAFYRFEITGNGFYIVERRDAGGGWTRFVEDWTASPAINQGIGVTNQLRVVANGGLFGVYVNDILLTEFSDSTYSLGGIGLDAGTFGGNTQVSFDNLIVRE